MIVSEMEQLTTMNKDKRNILKNEQPFSWKLTKNGKGLVYWQGKLIKTAVDKDFRKLEKLVAAVDSFDIQHFLARITGNFKHGNE